ncbi:hybrid sensor histidine kinase/response regulator [Ottowia flava]|uniref:histidine kinase n=1 Tax=Ottowia flava TaxID=2675430 RepID=A0ABW4KZI4_9BURK
MGTGAGRVSDLQCAFTVPCRPVREPHGLTVPWYSWDWVLARPAQRRCVPGGALKSARHAIWRVRVNQGAQGSVNASEPPLSLPERVRREQLLALFRNRVGVNLVALLITLLFWVACWMRLRNPWIPVWGVALHATQLLPMPWYRRFFLASERGQIDPTWVVGLHGILMASALVWSAAPWLMMPANDLTMTTVVVILMIGIISGSVASLASVARVMFTFTVPATAALCLALLRRPDALHALLALAVLAYVGVTLRFALRQHHLVADALAMRFEKEALAERLGEQIAATERASQEKTRFLATASHDLRQPLHAIALFGAALEHQLRQRERAEQQLAVELMRGVNALSASLDTMLDISRLDAGVVVPAIQACVLNDTLLAVSAIFGGAADAKGLQLRVRATKLVVRSDPQLLLRLLSNLVDNAIKYTQRGGVVVVARERADRVWLDVWDTGEGIAGEHVEQIFDEFFQVDNPGRDRGRGLGIGLSIVKRLSRLLHASVSLRTRLGVGSRFRIELAHAGSVQAHVVTLEAAREAQLGECPRPRRVLVLDDEDSIRSALLELLRGHGMLANAASSESAADRVLADARAAGQPFEVLVCDLRLANGANGLAIGKALQQRHGPGLALLIVTGETAPDALRQVRASGVTVLYKPVQAQRLLATISAVQAESIPEKL